MLYIKPIHSTVLSHLPSRPKLVQNKRVCYHCSGCYGIQKSVHYFLIHFNTEKGTWGSRGRELLHSPGTHSIGTSPQTLKSLGEVERSD